MRVIDEWSTPAAPTTIRLSRAALIGLLVLFGATRLAGVVVSLRTQAVVYLVGMVGLNLPHGGYEHLANLRRRTSRFRWWYVAGYLALAGAFVALFLAVPVVGLTLAALVAVAKGGGGDLYVLDATTGTAHLETRVQRLLAVAARGGAVMAVPFVAWPGTFDTFAGLMVGLVDIGAFAAAGPLSRPAVGGGYALVVLGHLGLGFARRTGDGAWLADAAETTLLVAYFAVVPPLVAVGLYFPLWYSTRQVGRELSVEETAPGRGRDLLAADAPGAVARRAWGVLVAGALATAVVAVAFWAFVPNPFAGGAGLYGAVAFWSVLISVIALPHVVVGGLLDRRRGIWHVP